MSAEPALAGRIALVTGASRGVGRACALALAQAGAHVVAVAQTQGALAGIDVDIRAATGEAPTCAPMDVADGEAWDRLADSLKTQFGHLDILVHAAALMGSSTRVSRVDPTDWARVYAVNVTGTFRMIRALEPLMLAAPAARAIFMSSAATTSDGATWSQYASSKSAMESLVRSWADEVGKTPVRAVLLEPTSMRTDMRALAVPNEDRSLLNDPAELGPLILQLIAMDPGRPRPNVVFSDWKKAGKPALA